MFRAGPNKPIASTIKDSHQRKYPILRSDLSEPKRTYQCVLTMKTVVATHAHPRCNERDPRNATHGEPNMKKSVVTALTVASTAKYQASKWKLSYGQTAQNATRNACHPGSPPGRLTPPLTTGRNQAVNWSSHAPEIRRWGLLILPTTFLRSDYTPTLCAGVTRQQKCPSGIHSKHFNSGDCAEILGKACGLRR